MSAISVASGCRKSRMWVPAILSFSTICTLAGTALLFNFDQTAGAVSAVPVRWPVSSAIDRPARTDALLVFVHPYCSCTVATLHEIASLSGGGPQSGQLSTTVLFYRPKNSGWLPGNLWSKANAKFPEHAGSGTTADWRPRVLARAPRVSPSSTTQRENCSFMAG
jgi:hypothetical protein